MNIDQVSQVLALKYRPRKFDDLIGQGIISQTLSLALDTNRLSHAYLFSGLRGSGKTSTARIMAKALLCSKGPTSKPCDMCDNCVSANEYRHLDIIEMDAASNRGIDDIKDLIEHTKYKPSSGRFKVFIIDEVHMLTPQAFNALLKTLEEPPDFVKFILATTDPLKLPATILSRTQHFRFKKIANKDVLHHLSHILNLEGIEFENEALEILARSGHGSLRDTLTLLDQAIIFSKGKVTAAAVTDMMGLIDPKFLDDIFDLILSRCDVANIISRLEEYEAGLVIDEMIIYLKQKMLSRDTRFDTLLFDRFFRILSDAKYLLSINSDSGFVLILTCSKMIEAMNLKTIDEVIDEIEKKKVIQESKTAFDVAKLTRKEVVTEVLQPKIEQSKKEPLGKELYKKLIDKIYDRSHDVGECFEKNFKFKSYSENTLHIVSFAQGECRELLRKNYSHIRVFIEETYGIGTEIEFEKGNKSQEDKDKNRHNKEQNSALSTSKLLPVNEVASMVEDIEIGGQCVADMCNTLNDIPSPAQKELQINDILNSPMVNKAKELFDPKKIVVKAKT